MPHYKLNCNDRKCLKEISEIGFITKCSHVFCNEHGRMLRRNWENAQCPACGRSFSNNRFIIEIKLHHEREQKLTDFLGASPDSILEIATYAAKFWLHQFNEELCFHRRQSECLKEKLREIMMLSQKHKRIYEVQMRKLTDKLEEEQAKTKQLSKQLLFKRSQRSHGFENISQQFGNAFVHENTDMWEHHVQKMSNKLNAAHEKINELERELRKKNPKHSDMEMRISPNNSDFPNPKYTKNEQFGPFVGKITRNRRKSSENVKRLLEAQPKIHKPTLRNDTLCTFSSSSSLD